MTSLDFARLGSTAFSVVARKRQALVAASRHVAEVLDADPCDRVCRCERRPLYDAAVAAESAAHHDLLAAEKAWADYGAIRRDDTRTVRRHA